jgi:hypothetical protein
VRPATIVGGVEQIKTKSFTIDGEAVVPGADGIDWVHEIKHDGYRMIVRRDGLTGAAACPTSGHRTGGRGHRREHNRRISRPQIWGLRSAGGTAAFFLIICNLAGRNLLRIDPLAQRTIERMKWDWG